MSLALAFQIATLVGGIGLICSTIGHAAGSKLRRGYVDVGEAVGYGFSAGLTSMFASLVTSSLVS